MPGITTVFQGVGAFSAGAGGSTLNFTVTATQAGATAFIAAVVADSTTGGTRTFSSTGSPNWKQDYVEANARGSGSAIPIKQGTTSITASNGGVNSSITAIGIEVGGLKPEGIVTKTSLSFQAGVNAWSTPALTVPYDAFVVAVASQEANGTDEAGTPSAGFTAISGTNITNGCAKDSGNGQVMFMAYGVFAAGTSVQCSGTWAGGTKTSASYLVAFELGPIKQAPTLPLGKVLLNARGVPLRTAKGAFLFKGPSPDPTVVVSSATSGAAQGPSQTEGGVIELATGQAQGPSQVAGNVVDITAGAAQGPIQTGAAASVIGAGEAQRPSQSGAGASESVVGQTQGPSQAAGVAVLAPAGSAQAPSQAQAKVAESAIGQTQGPSQAGAGVVDVAAGQEQGPSQSGGGVVELVGGSAASPSQGAGADGTASAVTIIAAGESASYAQAAGAYAVPAPDVPPVTVSQSGGGHKHGAHDENKARRRREQEAESELVYQSILLLLVELVASEVLDD